MLEAGSGIEGFLDHSPFASYVAGCLQQEPFKLVDVGCSGGIAPGWRTFGDRLQALAFDANAEEVARLTTAERNPNVRYVAGWIGMPEDHPLRHAIGEKSYWHNWPSGRLAYERSREVRRARNEGREPASLADYYHKELLKQPWALTPTGGWDLDYAAAFRTYPPSAAETARALEDRSPDRVIHLPPYLKAASFYDADFVKIDIDGPDYELLRDCGDLLAQPSLIGVSLEVTYYGSHDANDNSFHNVDRLMREKGFDLFGLSVRTYASAALPFQYLDKHPSMNAGGRPLQGDALYVRDLASRAYTEIAGGVSDEKLAKLAALFALFSLPDQAAEMLVVHRERLGRVLDVDRGLDILTAEIQPNDHIADGFKAYAAAFETEHPLFFDQYGARNNWMQEMIRVSKEEPVARQAAERHAQEAQTSLGRAREELERAQALAAAHQTRLAAIEGSTTWRLTAPLRKALGLLKGQR